MDFTIETVSRSSPPAARIADLHLTVRRWQEADGQIKFMGSSS